MQQPFISNPSHIEQLIVESHARSLSYGIDPNIRNPNQKCLGPRELLTQQEKNPSLFNTLIDHIGEFYDLLSPDDFMIAAVDAEGYILYAAGSEQLKADAAKRNCVPGYRWTERDVGTSAISLCLNHKVPIQIAAKDHFCRQAHPLTSSAAPIFGKDRELVGILVVSGRTELVHPHTLYMVVTAAKAIERQLRVLRRNKALEQHFGYMDQVLESAGTGLIIVNSDRMIHRVNRRGTEILRRRDLQGKKISELIDFALDFDDIRNNPGDWMNREYTTNAGNMAVHFLYTIRLVVSVTGEDLGAVITLEEMEQIQKLANNIAGTKARFTFDSLLGTSSGFMNALKLARKAASTDATVLLQGETGTGKELFAQAIHNQSRRSRHSFVPINCGAIPSELLESELFGYVEGTFTGAAKGGRPGKFELAGGGTILLDEIGDMPLQMQVKLLRVLQTGEVYRIGASRPVRLDTRIIACTHVDLSSSVKEGRFREDLFYRLNVIPITIPPLRNRGREDILKLAEFFMKRNGGRTAEMTPEVRNGLVAYHWPGNIRELENVIQRAIHLNDWETLSRENLGGAVRERRKKQNYSGTLAAIEREVIRETLEKYGGNMVRTARSLGISRATLYRKVGRISESGRKNQG
jgi:transcriptional regulator of acetoin/glycerol metabolism